MVPFFLMRGRREPSILRAWRHEPNAARRLDWEEHDDRTMSSPLYLAWYTAVMKHDFDSFSHRQDGNFRLVVYSTHGYEPILSPKSSVITSFRLLSPEVS